MQILSKMNFQATGINRIVNKPILIFVFYYINSSTINSPDWEIILEILKNVVFISIYIWIGLAKMATIDLQYIIV